MSYSLGIQVAGPTLQAETAADGICAQNWVPPPGQERVGNGPPSPQQTLVLQLGSAGERRGARPGRPVCGGAELCSSRGGPWEELAEDAHAVAMHWAPTAELGWEAQPCCRGPKQAAEEAWIARGCTQASLRGHKNLLLDTGAALAVQLSLDPSPRLSPVL